MSNMSYCRFQNTASDFRDCVDHFWDTISEEEHRYRLQLLKMAKEIAEFEPEELEDLVEREDDEEEEKLLLDGTYQCCSCEKYFNIPAVGYGGSNMCPHCSSGNFVIGCIDEEEE